MESPKERFLKTPEAKAWAELSHNKNLYAAIDAVLLELMWNSSGNDPGERFQALMGATQFAHCLTTICDLPEKPKPKFQQNLEP